MRRSHSPRPSTLDPRPSGRDLRPIAVTAGEPAGIGPDLCVGLARSPLAARVVIVADRELLANRARALRIAAPIVDFEPGAYAPARRRGLAVRHVPLAVPAVAGRLDPANSAAVLRSIDVALDGCRDGTFS